jgi:actin-related protein 6
MSQAGLAESIAHSIASLPEEVRGMFWANIVCVGGNAGFDGFGKRLYVLVPLVFFADADSMIWSIGSQN